jgi:hypothetical protein
MISITDLIATPNTQKGHAQWGHNTQHSDIKSNETQPNNKNETQHNDSQNDDKTETRNITIKM